MKKHHPSKHSTPKRSRVKKSRVQYQPPREETPFSKPHKRHIGLADAVYLVITVMAGSALLGLCQNSFATYMTTRAQLNSHTAQLHQLQTKEISLHQKLVDLNSPDGRDQLLRERGFVQGNERILLFADDAQLAGNENIATPTSAPATATPVLQATPQPVSANKPSFLGGIAKAIDHAADSSAVH